MLRIVRIILLLIISFDCYAQQNDLDLWVQKIKVNYPGYKEKTDVINFDSLVEKTIKSYPLDTFKIMSKIADFFNDSHLTLFKSKDIQNEELCNKNLKTIKKYLKSLARKEKYEGYWLNDHGNCVLAIKKTLTRPLQYEGYVIESLDSNLIKPGMLYATFEQVNDSTFFSMSTGNHSANQHYMRSNFRNDSIMTMGAYSKWKRLRHYTKAILPSIPQFNELIATGGWLDSNNYTIRIPASTIANGKIIDSLIKSNPRITQQLENLIIDLRYNTGGTVRTYTSLLPLLYTNPILKINSSLYCTEDNTNASKKELNAYIKRGKVDSESLKNWQEGIKMREDSVGKYLQFPQDTLVFDSIMPYPRHIAFIINYSCQSAAEMILLNALQSKKVTLFGEHTAGAVDYLDFYTLDGFSPKYELYIPATKRTIPKDGHKLDGVGIYPQVPISDNEKDWVDFVKKYYETH